MDFSTAYNPRRALGVAYRLVRRAPLTLILGGGLLFLTDPLGRLQGGVDLGSVSPRMLLALLWATSGSCVLQLLRLLFNSYLRIGYVGAVQRVLVTGEENAGDLFQGRGLLVSMVLARLGKWLGITATALPFTIAILGSVALGRSMGVPAIGILGAVVFGVMELVAVLFVGSGLLLVEEAVAIEGLDPGAAFQRSWSIARGRRLELLFYALVMALIRFLGGVVCCMTLCIGWVLVPLAVTWVETAWTESYLRFALPEPEEGIWVERDMEQASWSAGPPPEGD
ncbi:MAG TPA: hypothetical protein ENJ09_04225 [Planctomycetes bacterium]|nr:hypothetical protein [Planctomycetota bacterium]